MKTSIKQILIALLTLLMGSVNAQTLNWANLKKENHHIINANFGMEYGTIYGLSYAYQINTRVFPIVANMEYSFPSGHNLFDDMKTKIGGQIRLIQYRHFQFSAKLHGVFRRHETELVRLLNFGSDFSGILGYYRPKWFFAGEFGFDKAIVSHFKHSNAYRDQHPQVVDGWYEPATGGNFYYGFQTGFSIKKQDIYLKAGKMYAQDFKTKPLLPFYGQLGVNFKF